MKMDSDDEDFIDGGDSGSDEEYTDREDDSVSSDEEDADEDKKQSASAKRRRSSVDVGDETQQHGKQGRTKRRRIYSKKASPSKHVGTKQTFQVGDRQYVAWLEDEDAAVNPQGNRGYYSTESFLCGGGKYGQDCRHNFGSNRWKIQRQDQSEDQSEEVMLCAICEKGIELESAGSDLVGEVVPWVPWGKEPRLVKCKGIGPDNKTPMDMSVPVIGGDVAFATKAVEEIGLKVYSADKMESEEEIAELNQWLKDKEKTGNDGYGLMLHKSDSRGSSNLNSGLNGTDPIFWNNLKEDVRSQRALKGYLEEFEKTNNVTACWLVLYLTNGAVTTDNKEDLPSNKGVDKKRKGGRKKKGGGNRNKEGNPWKVGKKDGRHRLHADRQYMGLVRAILSLGESYDESAQKVMRIVDRVTGRWFEMLVQHGTVVEMNSDMGGVRDKRYMHEVRNAAGTYTLCIEFSPMLGKDTK